MGIRGLGRRWIVVLGVVVAGVLAVPAVASAGTVSITGSTLTYSAAAGEQNDVSIEKDGNVFRVMDDSAPATAGAGCVQRALHRVNCTSASINLVEVFARDQDDIVQIFIGTIDANLNGGSGTDELASDAGDDTLTAGRSAGAGFGEFLSGGAGQDVLNGTTSPNSSDSLGGGPDNDQLLGGPGSDQLFGGAGADDMQGGDSPDNVSFDDGAPVTVTFDNVANDGAAGENDNVHDDIEGVFGTSFGDTLIGTTGPQTLFAFGGQDTIQGGPDNDNLQGGDGADTITGDDGSDQLVGGNDPDDLSGGAGSDIADFADHSNQVTVTINNVANDGGSGGAEGDNVHTDVENLRSGSNDDTLTGSTGDNRIEGQDGNDTINGVGGDDELFGDFQFTTPTGGNDTLNGGNGDDRSFGGAGADDMTGGSDFDFADYSGFNTNPNTITIDNVANDGAAGEGDNVRVGVEGVVGGNGPDVITGNSGINTLQGGLGADELHGAGGSDLLLGDICCTFSPDVFDGGVGDDTVTYRDHFFPMTADIDGVADDGGSGGAEGDNVQMTVENLIGGGSNDTLTGNNANNTIAGGNGSDTLIGGAGGDTLAGNIGGDTSEGQAGKDEINSRNDGSIDTDNCGTEADVATADAFDIVNADCETRIP